MHIRFLLAVFCVALIAGCGRKHKAVSGWIDTIGVDILVVDNGLNSNERYYVGDIGSEVEADMSFMLGGTLTKVAVHNGQVVAKGQVLAEVDPTTAQSLHNTSLAVLRQAEDAYERLKAVHSEGGISEVQWVDMETNLEKARQSEVAARKRLEQSVLKAPFAGIVSCTDHHVGQDMRPTETFAKIIDLNHMRVVFSVPEVEIGLLAMGTKASATIPALDNRELSLRVSDKSLLANPMGHTYQVFGTIVSGDTKGLLPDMVARVHVELNKAAGIVVPSECVQTMPEGYIVWVVNGGKAYHRSVQVGDFVNNGVLINSGLQCGDTVVIRGQQKLYIGAKVRSL